MVQVKWRLSLGWVLAMTLGLGMALLIPLAGAVSDEEPLAKPRPKVVAQPAIEPGGFGIAEPVPGFGPAPPGFAPGEPGRPMGRVIGPAANAVAAYGDFVYVLRGNTLYQYRADGLKLVTKVTLPDDQWDSPPGVVPSRPLGEAIERPREIPPVKTKVVPKSTSRTLKESIERN